MIETPYSKLRAEIKVALRKIVATHRYLKQDKLPSHILNQKLADIEFMLTNGIENPSSPNDIDTLDPVRVEADLETYIEQGKNTEEKTHVVEGAGLFGLFSKAVPTKEDHPFIKDLSALLAILKQKSLHTMKAQHEAVIKAEKPSNANAASATAKPKDQETISPEDLSKQIKEAAAAAVSAEVKKQLAPVQEELTKTKTDLANEKEQSAKLYHKLELFFELLKFAESNPSTLLSIEAGNPGLAQQMRLAITSSNSENSSAAATPKNTNNELTTKIEYIKQVTTAIDFEKYVKRHSSIKNGEAHKEGIFKQRHDLLLQLILITYQVQDSHTISVAQLFIYHLLRFKYQLTIKGVFDLLDQSLKANQLEIPERIKTLILGTNKLPKIPGFAETDELKVPIDQDLTAEEATMFYKLYAGTSKFQTPILKKDETAKNDFEQLALHQKNHSHPYERQDHFSEWLSSLKLKAVELIP